jgi:transposase
MRLHANAPLDPSGRGEMVRRVLEGHAAREVAEAFRVSERTVRKWLARYRTEGTYGLLDRTSRPHHTPTATPEAVRARIEELRRQRWTGLRIATQLGLSPATVYRVLQRLGLERLRKLEGHPVGGRYG